MSANSTPPKDADSQPSINFEGLSSNHVAIIEMLFSSQIISHAPITLDIVRNTIAKQVDLRAFGKDSRMVKRIYNKVCYLRRKEKENVVLPSNDPDPPSSRTEAWVNVINETTSVSVTTSRSKAKWNQEGEKSVEKFFSKYPVCPDKEALRTLFSSVDYLKDILDRNDGNFERDFE